MAKAKGLGRGLDALFSDNSFDNIESAASNTTTLKIYDIEPNINQPRRHFDPDAISELSASIAKHGLIQPIVVRSKGNGLYEIIAGERRWRACKQAGLIDIPVVIKDYDDITASQVALIENLQREDLNPIEEAKGYRKLMNDFGFTQEQLSEGIGKSRSSIANTLRLLKLPEKIIELVETNALSEGHARTLLGAVDILDEEKLLSLCDEIIKNDISVRVLEKMIASLKKPNEETPKQNNVLKEYFSHIEKKASESLGRKVKLSSNSLTISFNGNDDLESFLKKLCGNEFFNE